MKQKKPFTILIDTREKPGYRYNFNSLLEEFRRRRPKSIEISTRCEKLDLADFGILEYPEIRVERKSKSDLYSSLTKDNREVLRKRIKRMNSELEYGAVVVESSWPNLIKRPPEHSKLNPKSVAATIFAWSQAFPRVHWWLADTPQLAERITFRCLELYFLRKLKYDGKDTDNG